VTILRPVLLSSSSRERRTVLLLLSVFRCQFQLVTNYHQLASLIAQALFEFVSVFPGDGRIRLLCEDADDVDDRENHVSVASSYTRRIG
jgi:hypothetical protein